VDKIERKEELEFYLWSQPCVRYHSRLAELVAIKKGEDYATTMSWIRTRTSFALLRSALTCLRGSRARKIMYDIKNIDFNIENADYYY
jgi:hypothetical protein